MGGSRLTRFMKTVERATGEIPEAMETDGEERDGAEEVAAAPGAEAVAAAPAQAARAGQERPDAIPGPASDTKAPSAPAVAPAQAAPPAAWADLAAAGLNLIQKLTEAMQPTVGSAAAAREQPTGTLVERDQTTGQSYLRLPLPDADTLAQFTRILETLAGKR